MTTLETLWHHGCARVPRAIPGGNDVNHRFGLHQPGVRRDLDRSVFLRTLVREIGRDPELAAAIAAHVAAGRVRTSHAPNAALLAAALERGGA